MSGRHFHLAHHDGDSLKERFLSAVSMGMMLWGVGWRIGSTGGDDRRGPRASRRED